MKKLIVSAALMFSAFVSFAQHNACGTDEIYKAKAEENPEVAAQRAAFNAAVKESMKSYNPEAYRVKGFGKNTAPKYIIPVVVHVFHQNGSENISDAQIQSEIAQLNKSFRKLNSDTNRVRSFFKDIAADAQIEFRLAKKDPQGNCTNGIVRFYTPLTAKGNDNLKKLSVWDSKRYFNIWVVRAINKGAGVGVAGYAQFPFYSGPGSANSASTDGIMVIHNEFGNIGTSTPGQTVNVTTSTHEAGHWLGLYHPFQGDSCDNEGDGVSETPTTYKWQEGLRNGSPANVCLVSPCSDPTNVKTFYTPNTCGSDNPDLPDMIENFMDYYIGDSCSNMFTLEQVARMHFCLENYRSQLWSPANLIATGTDGAATCSPSPIAAFSLTTPGEVACVGTSLNFRDNTYNASATSWLWEFGDGATPATSTSQNPTGITYTTPGKKTVRLTSTGPNGTSTAEVKEFVTIQGSESIYGTGNGFYNADWDYINDFLDKGWYFENEQPATWKRTQLAKVDGNTSLVLEANSLSYGFTYSLISPTFNLTGASNPYFKFQYSFAPNYLRAGSQNDSRDVMQVYVSYDCGKNWQLKITTPNGIADGTPNTLNTAGAPTQPSQYYTPINESQWKEVTMTGANVGSSGQYGSLKFKVSFTYKGGNNFYLDKAMVGVQTAVNEITAKDINFTVMPNPFSASATIQYELQQSDAVKISIYDIVGKEIGVVFNGKQASGKQSVEINKADLGLSTGMYFVKTTVGSSTFSTKVMIN
jgi:PKD repeat protein